MKDNYKILYFFTNEMYYEYIEKIEDIENKMIINEMYDTIKCAFCDYVAFNRKDFDNRFKDYLEHIISYFNLKTKLFINTPIPTTMRELLTQEYKLQEMLQVA